ncbi:MAG: Gfo/Idh/MocA family oxidoreductase [Spirochaetaceae bacterium]|nr:Gfo/Idh/MocA family oxidoreductase [Spirochaetaceae bacterium]
MTKKTNLVIIGFGYMGKVYRKACLELYKDKKIETYYKYDFPGMLKGFSLKAIVDTRFESSIYNSEEGIWYFSSLQEMLTHGDPEVDAAIIATPIKTHYSIASELIQNGISLLIEKPVCETAREVKKLIDLAKKYQVRIMPGHVERYNPVTLDAVEAVQHKVYGKVKKYRFIRESSKPERVKDSLVLDKLIHDLDLAECIFGRYRISEVKAKKIDGDIMQCIVSTSHRKGIHGTIVSSWLVNEKKRNLVINFERGVLECDLIEKKIGVNRYGELSKQISGYNNNQIKDQLVDFIAYKNKYIKTLVTMKDALKAAYLIDEVNRRIDHGF